MHFIIVCVCVCVGVCLGLQVAVIEFARNVLGWKDAQSTEFDKDTAHPMVSTVCVCVFEGCL